MAQNGDSRNSVELPTVTAKPTLSRWMKKNPNVVKGIAAGALLVVMVLLLGWQMGWFSGGNSKGPPGAATASQPTTPPTLPPSHLSAPPMPSNRPQEPLQSGEMNASEQPRPQKKTEPEKEKNPLPDDLSKWKKEDYFRARKENDPRLLQAIARLGKKAPDSISAAQLLTELLKQLPVEAPAADSSSVAPGQTMSVDRAKPRNMARGVHSPKEARRLYDLEQRLGHSMSPGAETASLQASEAGPQPGTPLNIAKLDEAVLAALCENGTDEARKTLEQILSGTFTTEDSRTTVEAALRALIAHPDKENNRLLLWALIGPAALRPEDRHGAWPTRELQSKAMALIKATATGQLRAELAEALADRVLWLSMAAPLREFLLAPDPLNCGAQIALYTNKSTNKKFKLKIEQQLTNYSANALARLLEVSADARSSAGGMGRGGFRPAPGGYGQGPGVASSERGRFSPARDGSGMAPGGFNRGAGRSNRGHGESEKLDADVVSKVTGLLWSSKFRGSLETRVSKIRSFKRQPLPVLMASTIPLDSTRAVLAKLLRKHWLEGAKDLEEAGWPDQMFTDPGLLVAVKLLPRRDPKDTSAGRMPGGGRGVAKWGGGESLGPAQKKEQAEQDWMSVSSRLVTKWCGIYYAAALVQERLLAESGYLADDAGPKLPPNFTLSPNAKVIAAYHVRWPEDVSDELTEQKLDLLEIHYLRFEEFAKPRKAIGYYTRQAQVRPSDARPIDRGMWIDGQRRVQPDHRRSIDVLLTWPDAQDDDFTRDDQEVDLTVEVLAIEIKDPMSRN